MGPGVSTKNRGFNDIFFRVKIRGVESAQNLEAKSEFWFEAPGAPLGCTTGREQRVYIRKWITEGTMDVCVVITANTLSVRSVRKGSEQMYPMAPEERAGTARKLKKEIARRHWVKGHPFQPLLARLESPRPLRRRGGGDARMSGYTISFSSRA